MTAALVPPGGATEELDGLRLLLATRDNDAYLEVKEVADVAAGTETIDTSGANRLVVLVVNTLTSGDSRKPAFCAGTVEEVAACSALYAGAASGSGGGGTGGTGGTAGGGGAGASDGGGGDGGGAAPPGCGCRVDGSTEETGRFGAIAALLAAVYLRRGRPPARERAAPASASARASAAP
jgi:hypothetical protein